MSILRVYKIKTGKVWVAADAKNFYANNMQVYTSTTDRVREKKQDLQVVKGMVCHMYGTRRGVTADNLTLWTSREYDTGWQTKEEQAWNCSIISQWKTKRGLFVYTWFYQ